MADETRVVARETSLQVGNVTFEGALPSLEDCLARVAWMVEAFEKGSPDLRDIRTADVIALVAGLRFRASVLEDYHRGRSALATRDAPNDEVNNG